MIWNRIVLSSEIFFYMIVSIITMYHLSELGYYFLGIVLGIVTAIISVHKTKLIGELNG